jgi:GTP:adenosylcobinamide-phosphate guanylyltransferase
MAATPDARNVIATSSLTGRHPIWTVVILAGERPGGDPFAQSLGIAHKALVPVGGRPMLSRVIEAFEGLADLARIIVVTNQPDALLGNPDIHAALAPANVELLEAAGSIADSILRIAGDGRSCWPILVTTADHALLTRPMVEALLSSPEESDVAIGLVDRRVVKNACPDTKRTWLRFRGGAYTGANLFVLRNSRVRDAIWFWRSLEQHRKRQWALMLRCGVTFCGLVLFRLIRVEEALARLGNRFSVQVRPVLLADAAAGVDVDNAADLILAEQILAERGSL